MIQFKRGTSDNWKKQKEPLADGQPGYDKTKHKIKVGDGKSLWNKLPYASISEEEVLDSEVNAKIRLALDPESLAIMTYGTEKPDKDTIGKLYLQYYDTDPEADHIIEMGSNGIWTYRKWRSGLAECWGTYVHETALKEPFSAGTLYSNTDQLPTIEYPHQIKFDPSTRPCESATIQSTGIAVWLVSTSLNTAKKTAAYYIIGAQEEAEESNYYITFNVKGRWIQS